MYQQVQSPDAPPLETRRSCRARTVPSSVDGIFAACVGEYGVAYIIGTTVCVVAIFQWVWWQITHPGVQESRQERRDRRLAKKARKRFERRDDN